MKVTKIHIHQVTRQCVKWLMNHHQVKYAECIYCIINVGFCDTSECQVFLSGFIMILTLICISPLVIYVLNKKYQFLKCDNDNCIRRCCN